MNTQAFCFLKVLLVGSLFAAQFAHGQAVDPFYSGVYSIRTLADITGVPREYGGVIIRTNNPNLLLVAGDCTGVTAKIYQIQLLRGADGHITNFMGSPVVFANTPGGPTEEGPPWTGLQGDRDFGPGEVVFYISPDNFFSQIKPGSITPSKQIDLGVAAGLIAGTVVIVPPRIARRRPAQTPHAASPVLVRCAVLQRWRGNIQCQRSDGDG